jgi:hypothetical protein
MRRGHAEAAGRSAAGIFIDPLSPDGRVPPDDGMPLLARSAALAHSTDRLTMFDWHMERDALLVMRSSLCLVCVDQAERLEATSICASRMM